MAAWRPGLTRTRLSQQLSAPTRLQTSAADSGVVPHRALGFLTHGFPEARAHRGAATRGRRPL